MNKIIIVIVLLCSFTLSAQDKTVENYAAPASRIENLMDKISSDPVMRADMIALMVFKTKDDKVELMKLAELFTRYPELNKMILQKLSVNANNQYMPLPRGTDHNSKLIEIKPIEAMPIKTAPGE